MYAPRPRPTRDPRPPPVPLPKRQPHLDCPLVTLLLLRQALALLQQTPTSTLPPALTAPTQWLTTRSRGLLMPGRRHWRHARVRHSAVLRTERGRRCRRRQRHSRLRPELLNPRRLQLNRGLRHLTRRHLPLPLLCLVPCCGTVPCPFPCLRRLPMVPTLHRRRVSLSCPSAHLAPRQPQRPGELRHLPAPPRVLDMGFQAVPPPLPERSPHLSPALTGHPPAHLRPQPAQTFTTGPTSNRPTARPPTVSTSLTSGWATLTGASISNPTPATATSLRSPLWLAAMTQALLAVAALGLAGRSGMRLLRELTALWVGPPVPLRHRT